MKKHLLQTLLVVVLSVIGVSQCWAEEEKAYYPFSYVGCRAGQCDYDANSTMYYSGMNNSIGVDDYSHATYGDGCAINIGSYGIRAGSKSGFIALYKYDCPVEPYTKVVLTYSYSLSGYSVNLPQVVALYKFDDENTAKTTSVDWTHGFFNKTGSAYRDAYVQYQGGTSYWQQASNSIDFVFDNLTGTSEKSISKFITVVLCEAQPTAAAFNTSFRATLKCTNAEYAYTYRKVITFNGNGSTGGSMDAQNIDNSGNLTSNAFARTGYVFAGWNTKADGTGTAYANSAEITATASDKGAITLYAQWKKALTWTRKGYHCYAGGDGATLSYNEATNTDYLSSFTWDAGHNNMWVTFDVNTMVGSAHFVIMPYYEASIEVPSYAKLVKKAKFSFLQSATASNITSTLSFFDTEAAAKSTQIPVEGNKPNPMPDWMLLFNTKFNATTGDGGGMATDTKEWTLDNSTGASDNTWTKYMLFTFGLKNVNYASFYNVHGWSHLEQNDETDTWYYYKHFTFNGNGSTSGSMSKKVIENSGNLTTNAFTRTGYTFTGWNTKADGTGTSYTNGQAITATASDKGEFTLYAQWKRTVTIDKQDGTSTTTIEVNCNSTYSTLPADPTRTGYTFNGWFDAKTGGKQYTKTTASTNDIPATIYAQWTAIVYNITYNVNGGSEITEHLTYTIETTTFALPVPEKDGYTFGGWFTNEACTEGQTTQIVKGSTGNKTFYAKWTPIVYNITYNENGGSAITEHLTYTIETETFALPVPTKDGYTFGGWFTNEACTEGQTTQIVKGSTGNKTFYALWSENVVSDGSDKDNVTDAAAEVNTALSTLLEECKGGKAINLTINRTIYKDGYYNTLCLPFDMSAAQIAATFGDYKELKQFQSATVQGTLPNRSIVIEVEDATTIEAGKAYLISFENNGEDLTSLTFNNVIVSTIEATNESGTLAYQGILAPYQLPYEDQDYLFLGANNTLYWAINDGTFMKGFRAYFKVNTNPAQTPYRAGMRATFGSHHTPTDLSPAVSGQEVRKLVEQGRVVIVNKGVKYNMNGATIQ